MENIHPLKRIYYSYLGSMFWLIHWSDTHRFLGIRASTFIRLITLFLPVLAWIQGWGPAAVVLALIIFVWMQFSYWRARRQGYYRFISDPTELLAVSDVKPLQKDKHIPVCATGIFSVKDWEVNVVFRPAEYWQVPLGDHALMVQQEPGRYLYQFVKASLLKDLSKGWLLFGLRPNPALCISFLSSWGPEFYEDNFDLLGRSKKQNVEKLRTVYLSFTDENYEEAVWHNLLYDARRVRAE